VPRNRRQRCILAVCVQPRVPPGKRSSNKSASGPLNDTAQPRHAWVLPAQADRDQARLASHLDPWPRTVGRICRHHAARSETPASAGRLSNGPCRPIANVTAGKVGLLARTCRRVLRSRFKMPSPTLGDIAEGPHYADCALHPMRPGGPASGRYADHALRSGCCYSARTPHTRPGMPNAGGGRGAACITTTSRRCRSFNRHERIHHSPLRSRQFITGALRRGRASVAANPNSNTDANRRE
jgi:hypothetical protein